MTTKTEQALALVDQGMKPFAAARQIGVSPNGVYLALKKRREALTEDERAYLARQVHNEGKIA